MLFPKLSIDMAIQLQALSVHAFTSQLYIIIRKDTAPIYKLSHSKAPKTQLICHYRHTRKTSRPFSLCDTGIYLSSRNNFFANVSIPLGSIIPCWHTSSYELFTCFKLIIIIIIIIIILQQSVV